MQKVLFTFLFLGCFLFGQEKIQSFHSDLEVLPNGALRVTETIQIFAQGDIFKRGLVRRLPLRRIDKDGRSVRVNYILNDVKNNGKLSNHFIKEENGDWAIYIGDKNVFLKTGNYTYQITYTTSGQIGFFNNYDEIYWNVNGFEWDVSIDQISATVMLPNGTEVKQHKCYTGKYRSTDSDCQSIVEENKVQFSAEKMNRGENLTIAVGFPKGVVPAPAPPTFFEKFGFLIISILAGIGLLIYYLLTWLRYGIDPKKPTVFPQFDIPENLSPAAVGMFHKEKYWSDLITTSIVNLGIKGYLKIEERETGGFLGVFKSKDFTLLKLKDVEGEEMPEEEKVIMKELFAVSNDITISGSYNANVKSAVNAFKSSMYDQHSELINKGNNFKFVWVPLLVIIGVIAYGVFYSDILYSSESIFLILIGSIGYVPFLILFWIVFVKLRLNLKYIKFALIAMVLIASGLIIYDTLHDGWHAYNLNPITLASVILFGVVSIPLYGYLIKRPEEEKLRIQSLIDGFKMYLGTAEEKQLQHFNPPNMTPEVYEKLLPYAIALGTEDVWGKKFQKLIDNSIFEPTETAWYSGTHFSHGNFGHSLNSSLSNSISSSSVKPSSSGGGSWSSGSGGGGFSGGGGGGGGGGGW